MMSFFPLLLLLLLVAGGGEGDFDSGPVNDDPVFQQGNREAAFVVASSFRRRVFVASFRR